MTQTPKKQGTLEKRGSNWPAWRERFFVLQGDQLNYYKQQGDSPAGSIRLHPLWTVQVDTNEGGRFVFVLQPPGKNARQYICAASSAQQRTEWIDAINSTIKELGFKPDTNISHITLNMAKDTNMSNSNSNISSSSNNNNENSNIGSSSASKKLGSTQFRNSLSDLNSIVPVADGISESNSARSTTINTATTTNTTNTTTTITTPSNSNFSNKRTTSTTLEALVSASTVRRPPTPASSRVSETISSDNNNNNNNNNTNNPTCTGIFPSLMVSNTNGSGSMQLTMDTQPIKLSNASVVHLSVNGASRQKPPKVGRGYVIALALAAVIHLCVGAVIFCALEHWSFLDAFYFCFVTLTTIGYGDFHPTTSISRLVMVAYALIGLGLIAQVVSTLQQRAAHRVLVQMELEMDGELNAGAQKSHNRKRLVLVVFVYLATIAVGAPLFSHLEGWSLIDSFYFCTITLTTIGYGDFVPTTPTSKIVLMVYAMVGIAAVAEIIAVVQQQVVTSVLSRLVALGEETSDVTTKPQPNKLRGPTLTAVFSLLLIVLSSLLIMVLRHMSVKTQSGSFELHDSVSFPDALYFAVVTFTTVGFGDIVPTRSDAKIFLMFYALVLLGVMGVAVQSVQLLLCSLASATETAWADQNALSRRFLPATRQLIVAVVLVGVHFTLGAAIFGWIEHWTVPESLYFAAVTTATIGYGDITPVSVIGRLLFVPYSLLGIAALGYTVGIIGERERQKLEHLQMIAIDDVEEAGL